MAPTHHSSAPLPLTCQPHHCAPPLLAPTLCPLTRAGPIIVLPTLLAPSLWSPHLPAHHCALPTCQAPSLCPPPQASPITVHHQQLPSPHASLPMLFSTDTTCLSKSSHFLESKENVTFPDSLIWKCSRSLL